MPLTKKCEICGADFNTKPFFVKNGGGKYCSKECHHKGLKTGKELPCFICGEKTYKTLRQIRVCKSKKYFCSKSCQTKWRNTEFIGEKHGNWKDGRQVYRSVLSRHKVPKTCRVCETKDERVLAVHHIDRNRLNNILENLAWLCHNCHFLVHHHGVGEKNGLLK